MPDPLSIIRLAALLVFIGLVAVGLWLLEVAWWVVPPVMALALFIAWTIEWLAWRGTLTTGVIRETTAVASEPAMPVEEPVLPAEAIIPVPPPPEPAPALYVEPEPELPTAVAEPSASTPEAEQHAAAPAPEPDSAAAPKPEPEPAPPVVEAPPQPPPEPEPEPARPPVIPLPEPRRLRRPRMRLRPVPAPPPEPPAEHAAPSADSPVSAFPSRATAPRSWNLWDLERIAREEVRAQPERRDEWAYLFLHLRQFASADGSLPTEFDGLVRESFAGLLERSGA